MNPMNVPPMQPPFRSPMPAHDVLYALQQWQGKVITIQTTRGTLRGILQEVMPDHVHLLVNGAPFIVRIAEMVWFGPNLSPEQPSLSFQPNVATANTMEYRTFDFFDEPRSPMS